ncbi:cellulase [Pseudoxanthomonas broegbernensis]|uniref:Endoglucanase n=1 Tax=Pseudoxanthomonas broegbernensis TaxID=83619 RepID=A0A7V8K8I5_9GAMM|nr:glycoside hydrolase family 9 protein [Pseudoxanthomonas broegbernensis]KAF1688146.1 cellulase [Pseudoxanthomonas broegbernensis]MBB6065196.1 endoglucanase [Pseudoxanthomonas broegbernensis]
MKPRSPSVPFLAAALAALCASPACAAQADGQAPAVAAIRVDQLGYLPGARKLALVEGRGAHVFEVVREGDGQVVLRGELSAPARWEPAARDAAVADLSALSAPGRYRVRVEGLPPSDPFPVDPQAYAGLADAALKAFYFNRAGTALESRHAGRYARAAGHPDTKVRIHASAASASRPARTVVAAPKGWYDAGDYNKYVVNSGITTWTLLAAWEHYPGFFGARDIGIPESGDAVPDLLDEAWWNLEWMLSMQDPGDGGVYHKLTNLRFDGTVMPKAATQARYMVGKGTAAALDFAAVMATASRVYAPFEAHFPGQAARMREAAEAAWQWAQAHPDAVYRQPKDVHTGAYGDGRFEDEFAWAAAELYLLTGKADYLDAFGRHAAAPGVPSWADVGALGWISLAHHRERLPDPAVRERVEAGLAEVSAALAAQWRDSAWRLAMQPGDFVWGSNAVALNQAMLLLQGHRLTQDREYLDAAQSQLDYVLGRNPLGVSFVTGQGLRSPMHVHHRPSQADGILEPVPGWLSGGPNPGQQDAKDCPVRYASALPALSWLDHDCSYASNEVAINWNAPLVYVAAALQALTPP